MSKCLICGNELLTGDMHWGEQGMCNACWNKTFNKDAVVGIDLIDIYKDKILILEHQLAEKDKEIEQLKKNMEFDTAYYIKELVNVRKQVCDEIREKLEMDEYNTCENTAFCVYLDYLKEILDQIEQGEGEKNEHKSN